MRSSLLLAALLTVGCSLPGESFRSRAPIATAPASVAPHCSDRVDRARAGNVVGTVLGTVAASLVGSPFLGVFYKAAGYVMGFASGNPCAQGSAPVNGDGPAERGAPILSPVIEEESL